MVAAVTDGVRQPAMAAEIDRVRRRGYATSARADAPGTHQLIVRMDKRLVS
ncbi:hypothetical protein AB0E62_35680 [Streptomyces sp. NPDC038707]|uniref:hypothetical protein n=1 Tax=unclassified Streptomyces TaxID=2593676 RepID=UPI0033FF1572